MKTAFIALGTNIEPRKQYIDCALSLLAENKGVTLKKQSSIYETAPVGYLDQAHFLNLVIEVQTTLSSVELLDVCQAIERELGRERTIKNGPRTIDLDILIYNDENKQTERLTIPHPRMKKRAFVLIPLEEIASTLYIALYGKTVKELRSELRENDQREVFKWQ